MGATKNITAHPTGSVTQKKAFLLPTVDRALFNLVKLTESIFKKFYSMECLKTTTCHLNVTSFKAR